MITSFFMKYLPNLKFNPLYILGGLLTLLMVLTLWLSNLEKEKINKQLILLGQAQKISEANVAELKRLRAKDSASLLALQNDYRQIDEQAVKTKQAIAELEKNNESVKNYLDQRLPDDLAKLLRERSARKN